MEKDSERARDLLHNRLRAVWALEGTYDQARDALGDDHPELSEWREIEGEERLSCLQFLFEHRRRSPTTSGLERVNRE